METVNIHDAKTNFSKLIARVQTGETVIISRAGKPVARLGPLESPRAPRVPGLDRDKVQIRPDFDAPLAEFE
jgi:prevent-host-death family protein